MQPNIVGISLRKKKEYNPKNNTEGKIINVCLSEQKKKEKMGKI